MIKRITGILVLAGLLTVILVLTPNGLARRGSSALEQLDLLIDVRHELIETYVEEPDADDMVEAAVRAMVDSLNDPYTVFLTKEELEPFDKQIRGSFSGIGAEIDLFNDRLRIVSPLEESPAWKAGVLAGDIVMEIDGNSTKDISLSEAVKQLTGPEGTDVTILVRHESGGEETITITRAQINVPTVKGLVRNHENHWDYVLDQTNGIGYIRITQFTQPTADDLRIAIDELKELNTRGIILDLRFNPGGLLDSAVDVSDMFLTGNQRIVSVKGRVVPERTESSTDEATLLDLPVVVLANEASASAAEIVTGALSDNNRAKFIGTRTFGKGSVQQVRMLQSGEGALKITNAHYYLPSGRNIHRRENDEVWGVDPPDGFQVPLTAEQVRNMVKVRRESELLRPGGRDLMPDVITPDWISQELLDPQLAAALTAMQGYLTNQDWPIVGESGADEIARRFKKNNLIRQRDLIEERLAQIQEELDEIENPTGESAVEPLTDKDDPQASMDTPGQDKESTTHLESPETQPHADVPEDNTSTDEPVTETIDQDQLEPVEP